MITYCFEFDPENRLVFAVNEDSDSSAEGEGEAYPGWMRLDRHTCDVCSLPAGSRVTCPAALALGPVVDGLSLHMSYEKALVHATLGDVEMSATVPLQKALRSVVGLLLGLSSCPVLRRLRPMARMHLPFGRRRHTVFRFVGTYLVAQYLRERAGLRSSWELDGLLGLLGDLHEVNIGLAHRIREASRKDATVNGLILLDAFAMEAEMDVENGLEQLAPLFGTWLEEDLV